MFKFPATFRVLALLIPPLALGAGVARGQAAVPNQDPFPGYGAAPVTGPLPAVTSLPIGRTPLSARPYVFALEHRSPAAMSADDAAVVTSLSPELATRAALLDFDLASPGWAYRQIICPAFPDYVFLAFHHGPSPSGSSRFVAAMARDRPEVRIISTFSHGALPFDSPWTKPATYEIFNRILRQERGRSPLGNAPNWLVIGMCYAELSGYPVQVLTPQPVPGATLDLLRLDANGPELLISPNRAAEITFSDASKPSVTTNWTLRFNPTGQIVSAAHNTERQASKIALRP